jgi:hypothetical protein
MPVWGRRGRGVKGLMDSSVEFRIWYLQRFTLDTSPPDEVEGVAKIIDRGRIKK